MVRRSTNESALELGVPGSAILVEPETRNTGESIRLSWALLTDLGVSVESVLLISKPDEERRAYATARKLWPEVEIVSASAPMALTEYVDSIQDPRLVFDMLVGAQQRLQIYPQQGFLVHQDVPPAVSAAYERLRSNGFTSRLVAVQ